ncbi:ParA family protein [Arcobacter cloacae]|uniref:AAA domain-containing protein n=1 Tax=Arcobacter cloacae TaxID=1054034 RepID=A0A6M8NFC8_9BACT|nr:AAA family ATPase [Arcobacter cloacae]QKF89965.1 hypothetical protein ACLO_1471 [Arcobacter cloacae]RXI40239.1 hypothetical protein CP963_09155 [Arcobacter cloacae]
MNANTKTVLFYSFKGGVGRTQLMLNSAKYLASKGKNILMVDFDIHAPGLSYWDDTYDLKAEGEDYLLNYIIKYFSGEEDTNKLCVRKISDNLSLVPIYDMTNIRPYHELLVKFSQFSYDLNSKLKEKISENMTLSDAIFDAIKDKLLETGQYDYIFFDSRTGFTEIGDILFSTEVDLKILVSAYNKQNIKGINSVLDLINDESAKKKHNIIRVLSLKPKDSDNKIEQLKSEANLDDNKELKNAFNWKGIMEIDYASVIVTNDFTVWEREEDNDLYKKQVIDISNQIDRTLIGEKIEL